VALLKRFFSNSGLTRYEVRVKLGVLDELAAEVFALIVFLCDDLLQLKPAATSNPATTTTTSAAVRFFNIATNLPMELQMILCHRVVGSMKQNILHNNSEAAFHSLAVMLLFSSQLESGFQHYRIICCFSFPPPVLWVFFLFHFVFVLKQQKPPNLVHSPLFTTTTTRRPQTIRQAAFSENASALAKRLNAASDSRE